MDNRSLSPDFLSNNLSFVQGEALKDSRMVSLVPDNSGVPGMGTTVKVQQIYEYLQDGADYFDIALTIAANKVHAKRIEDLCLVNNLTLKDSYIEHKYNAAIDALVAVGFTTEQAQAVLKKTRAILKKQKKGK